MSDFSPQWIKAGITLVGNTENLGWPTALLGRNCAWPAIAVAETWSKFCFHIKKSGSEPPRAGLVALAVMKNPISSLSTLPSLALAFIFKLPQVSRCLFQVETKRMRRERVKKEHKGHTAASSFISFALQEFLKDPRNFRFQHIGFSWLKNGFLAGHIATWNKLGCRDSGREWVLIEQTTNNVCHTAAGNGGHSNQRTCKRVAGRSEGWIGLGISNLYWPASALVGHLLSHVQSLGRDTEWLDGSRTVVLQGLWKEKSRVQESSVWWWENKSNTSWHVLYILHLLWPCARVPS